MTTDQQRAAETLRLYEVERIAAALDAAEARGRAEVAAKIEALATQWDDMARDHDEQSATNTAVVYRAHARRLRALAADLTAPAGQCICEWNVESGNAGPDADCPQHGWRGTAPTGQDPS